MVSGRLGFLLILFVSAMGAALGTGCRGISEALPMRATSSAAFAPKPADNPPPPDYIPVPVPEPADRPLSYDSFVDAKTFPSIEDALSGNKYVYLQPGEYALNNPVIIDRDEPLFIHGGSRMDTVLKPKDPSQPLFIVRKVPLLNFAGIYILGAREVEYRNILFENQAPVQFELQDCFFDQGVLELKGPGSYRLQGTFVAARGLHQASLLIDHPQADLLVVGGNMNTRDNTVSVAGDQIFNVWQKRGRMRIYGTGIQNSAGLADFRADSASGLGPHVIAFVRSEGTNGYQSGTLASAHLYVPSSNEKVDVLLMANGGSWPSDDAGRNLNHFLNYNAAGTVWMIGNSAPNQANHIALGNAPNATIVAMGNRIYSAANNPFGIQAANKYDLGNTYAYSESTGDQTFPLVRFLNLPGTITSITNAPAVPKIPLPAPIPRPVLKRALPGMIDVKRDFGAVGDGTTDDTAALQSALVSGKVIYIPAGTYRTTQALGFTHSTYGAKAMGPGGWIAGAGPDRTILRRDFSQKGTVFATEGMAYITIQGISFETAKYDAAAPTPINESAVELEFNPTFQGAFATQEVLFYNCRFQGGRYGASTGLRTGMMGSENLFINSEFRNAKFGLAIGSYNALNNIAYGSVFRGNEITIGHDSARNTGGSGALLNVEVYDTAKQEISLVNTDGAPWYFHGVRSTTRQLFTSAHSSIAFQQIYDQCIFNPQPATDSLGWSLSGGGFYFLHSRVTSGTLNISSVMSVLPLFSLHSQFTDIGKTTTGTNGRVFQLP